MTKRRFSSVRELLAHSVRTVRRDGPDRLFLYGVRYVSWTLQIHRRVGSFPPRIATVIYVATRIAVTATIALLHRLYPRKYTDADPYKRLRVDPSVIEYTTGEILSKRRGWVVDGHWDREGNQFMERTYAKAIRQRFEHGLDWEETALADKFDPACVRARGERIDRLYDRIRTEGFKSQRELLEESPAAAWDGLNDAMHPLANDIVVDIGRDGELLWNICGQHRLAISKVLGIDEIEVQVFRRHAQWQAVRDQIRAGEWSVENDDRLHPDLEDLLE